MGTRREHRRRSDSGKTNTIVTGPAQCALVEAHGTEATKSEPHLELRMRNDVLQCGLPTVFTGTGGGGSCAVGGSWEITVPPSFTVKPTLFSNKNKDIRQHILDIKY